MLYKVLQLPSKSLNNAGLMISKIGSLELKNLICKFYFTALRISPTHRPNLMADKTYDIINRVSSVPVADCCYVSLI